ncbi:hypothetical protein ACIQBJ_32995 [Kitasatospora sp. NPDC088391]|uniref:hypothetical protein n=1 Tax=Kitasatospora sp. NPDC088391 TaxID=3364074 RepID=UPI0037F103EC
MSNHFTVLWTHWTCRELQRAGLTGQRPPVAFSGVHTSLPRWAGARPDSEVYAVHVKGGVLHLVSRMRVLAPADDRPCCRTPDGHGRWSLLGEGGCGAEAVHLDATPVRFDTTVPGADLADLTWCNQRGKVRQLKHVEDGRLRSAVSVQGFYRITADTADRFAALSGDDFASTARPAATA